MEALSVTSDVCKTWENGGKINFIRLCKSSVKSGQSALESRAVKDLKRILYEVCMNVLNGKIKIDSAIPAFAEVVEQIPESSSLLADVFNVIDIETQVEDDKGRRERFTDMVPGCTAFIPDAVLKERLDGETLENMTVLQSKAAFQSKYVKLKTKLYYKQQKFNLLREESEGYAKLLTELGQDPTDELPYSKMMQNIQSLIGCFDLDPNRVLDIILESFECRPEFYNFFVPLLHTYMSDKDTLCQVLGFKFHFYQTTQDCETPPSLYRVAALLLQHNLIDLDSLYPHLIPSDGDIFEKHKAEIAEAKEYARKLSVVVLSEKKTDGKDKDEKEAKLDQHQNNQKLGLCNACIHVGDWDHAKKIMDRMPPFFATSYPQIAESVCSLVNQAIEPLYAEYSGLPKLIQKHRNKYEDSKLAEKQVQTYQEMAEKVFPIIACVGPHLSCDTVLLVKLLRLGKAFINKRRELGQSKDEDDVVFRGFLTILDEAILPSLSLLPSNCCMSEEIWSFLKLLKYEYRYRLYGQWKNDANSQHPKLIKTRADCIDKAKYIMKRLSKENVKQLGRQIGKLSHSNPGVLFEHILSQIQRYDNFIGPVVDSLKFLTSLSYDVMAYCIIEALANPDREKMKIDDTNISPWLQSLASFSGAVFKKYQIELAGLIQYVVNQLKAGKSFDLLILREVVSKMAGIEISEEITDDQLDAMSGGELLRQEGGYFAQVRNTKRSSGRLKDALLEHKLAIPLCMLLAQQRSDIVFTQDHEDNRHLKLIGKLYDQCQDTFVQFASFLSLQLSTDEFNRNLPHINVLLTEFNIPADTAFALSRIIYSNAINAKFEEFRKADKKEKNTSSSHKTQRYIEAVDTVMNPVIDMLRPTLPEKTWEDLTPQFYATFWSLTMYDLYVPTSVYEKQIQQLRQQIIATEDNRDLAPSKKKKEKERCLAMVDKLQEEEKKQQDHVNRVMARFKHEKDTWFPARPAKQIGMFSFFQLCVFPRVRFTASDAQFCAKFIHILHSLKTPNFQSLICYDKIFCDITYFVSSCTENEAHRYGRFLCAVLDPIMRWHSDKNSYEKECGSYPGFITVFRKDSATLNKAEHLDYENFRHVCHKWHFAMTKAMVACLESGNYIQIRNSLIFLTKVLPHYPKITKFGQPLERRVDRICEEEKEKRPDIYVLAMGYAGQLKMKKKTWIVESQFHIDEKKEKAKAKEKVSNGPSVKDEKNGDTGTNKKTSVPKKDSSEAKENKERKSDKKIENKEIKQEKGLSDNKADKTEKQSSDRKDKESSKSSKEKDRSRDKEDKKNGREKERKEEKVLKEPRESKERSSKDKSRKEEKAKSRSNSKEKERDKKEVLTPSGGHRRSADPSPRHQDDREVKRRKIEAPSPSSTKDHREKDHHRSSKGDGSFYKSPAHDHGDQERENERERKVDRKRSTADDDKEPSEGKRHKSESSGKTKSKSMNGESEKSKRDKSEVRCKSPKEEKKSRHDKEDGRHKSKDSPDVRERKEKHSSKKTKK